MYSFADLELFMTYIAEELTLSSKAARTYFNSVFNQLIDEDVLAPHSYAVDKRRVMKYRLQSMCKANGNNTTQRAPPISFGKVMSLCAKDAMLVQAMMIIGMRKISVANLTREDFTVTSEAMTITSFSQKIESLVGISANIPCTCNGVSALRQRAELRAKNTVFCLAHSWEPDFSITADEIRLIFSKIGATPHSARRAAVSIILRLSAVLEKVGILLDLKVLKEELGWEESSSEWKKYGEMWSADWIRPWLQWPLIMIFLKKFFYTLSSDGKKIFFSGDSIPDVIRIESLAGKVPLTNPILSICDIKKKDDSFFVPMKRGRPSKAAKAAELERRNLIPIESINPPHHRSGLMESDSESGSTSEGKPFSQLSDNPAMRIALENDKPIYVNHQGEVHPVDAAIHQDEWWYDLVRREIQRKIETDTAFVTLGTLGTDEEKFVKYKLKKEDSDPVTPDDAATSTAPKSSGSGTRSMKTAVTTSMRTSSNVSSSSEKSGKQKKTKKNKKN